MNQNFFSPTWYRIAHLKPRVRNHSQIHRHVYRGELWYVLQDHANGRFYRFNTPIYRIIGMLDGKKDMNQIWETICALYGDNAPSQGDVTRLLSQLHSADALICDIPPDSEEIISRAKKIEEQSFKSRFRSPLFLRFPLIDPEKFLTATQWISHLIFSKTGFLIWLALFISAAYQVGLHWEELTSDIIDRILAKENLLILWFTYPLIKGFHELGHGYAVKRWGGEVHEMGIMLLVFMPIPYVDASAASAFRRRWQRVVVGSAGIMAELFLASAAMFVWVVTDPGIPRTIAYNTMLIGGVSTLLFNGNPLLRYDGYYIFSDLLNIPNLAQRSQQYLGYLTNTYLLHITDPPCPYTGPGERFWFVTYGITSFIYRLFVYSAIILFVAGKFFFVGILLAAFGGYNMVIAPLGKKLHMLVTAPLYQDRRGRSLLVVACLAALLLSFLFMFPFPYLSVNEGVVWAPHNSIIRAGASGNVAEVIVASGTRVEQGQTLLITEDPYLETRFTLLTHQLKEFRLRREAAYASDRIAAEILDREINNILEKLLWIKEQQQQMTIKSPKHGTFILPGETDIQGSFLRKGELLGYVIDSDSLVVRLVVPQEKADLIKERTTEISLRLISSIPDVYYGRVNREVPSAMDRLPSEVLGIAGGGSIAVDPMDAKGNKIFENMFQLDITPSRPLSFLALGSRVYVRFNLGLEPLAFQWYRSLRQLLLKRFNV